MALWTREPNRFNRGDEVERDLQIAHSEYAPDVEVVIDDCEYWSVGLCTPFEKNPCYETDIWFYECPDCHHVQVSEHASEERDIPCAAARSRERRRGGSATGRCRDRPSYFLREDLIEE